MAKNSRHKRSKEQNKSVSSKKCQITVQVTVFHGIHSHIELLLENKSVKPNTYYGINRWGRPEAEWSALPAEWAPPEGEDEGSSDSWIDSWMRSEYSFDIEANPDEIVEQWGKYYTNSIRNAHPLRENCAVATQKFLTHFADIPEPSSSDPSNISLNHLFGGIMWPSIIPCPVTLPGRIMDNVKHHIEKRKTRIKSIAELPSYTKESYKGKAAELLKNIKNSTQREGYALAKFNDLDKLYDCLDDLKLHADSLKNYGYVEDYQAVNTLLNNLNYNATEYLKENNYSKEGCQNFKKQCMQSICTAEKNLRVHRDWDHLLGNLALAVLGVGVFYVAAACINKAATGNFTFFNRTKSMKKADKVAQQLSIMEEQFIAIESKSLSA